MRLSPLVLVFALPLAVRGDLIEDAKDLAFAKKVEEVRALAEGARASRAFDDPQLLLALSWAGRGAGLAGEWSVAESYARETYDIASRVAAEKGADSSADLATALGAAIEVLGGAKLAADGPDAAVAYWKGEREKYRGTSIEKRIQKNVLSASLEGTPMPKLEPERYLGKTAPMSTDGKVAVYYFWAHWCPTSKRQRPHLFSLHDRYADKGVTVVGPTTLFGFAKKRDEKVTPEEEIAYVEGAWQEEYPLPDWMSRPMSKDFFADFGVSTTPTIVITDRKGVVRVYHPGLMTLEELEAAVKPLL
ncbi:MAG: TlpA disulfide reductase family protein [Bryobacterales bacterium]